MVQPVPIPAIRAERCVIYCLSCGRSTTTATYVVEGLFGWLPYGRVTNRLHCRKGCGDRFGMVLPLDAPTPRLFAQRYQLQPAPKPKPEPDKSIEADCRDILVELNEDYSFIKIHAKVAHPEIAWWGFDFLLKRYAKSFRGSPHLVVARGAQWTRDSKRDYKVVGGKAVEKTGDDPDEEEDGSQQIDGGTLWGKRKDGCAEIGD